LLRSFQEPLEAVFARHTLHPSWSDPKRRLAAAEYLSLFFFGLLNPIAQTLRGLAAASQLERVQREVCQQPISRASFSEAQHVLEPALLEAVLTELAREVPAGDADPRLADWAWQARDGSLFRALPRMSWALYGAGAVGAPNRAVRLHLSLHLLDDTPVQAAVRRGRDCERAGSSSGWPDGEPGKNPLWDRMPNRFVFTLIPSRTQMTRRPRSNCIVTACGETTPSSCRNCIDFPARFH